MSIQKKEREVRKKPICREGTEMQMWGMGREGEGRTN